MMLATYISPQLHPFTPSLLGVIKMKIVYKGKDLMEGWVGTLVYIVLGIVIAYSINFLLGIVLKTDLPVVAVVSRSMTHDETTPLVHYMWLEQNLNLTREEIDSWPLSNGFRRGDILVVVGVDRDELKVGDVIVFSLPHQKVPVVHRIIKIEDGVITTKGDHNPAPDPWKVKYEDIHGKAVFVIPYLGYVKVIFSEMFGVWW